MVEVLKSYASNAGYHFYTMHDECQRKFYIRYVKRIVSRFTPIALVRGIAIHAAKEHFYKNNFNPDVMIEAFNKTMYLYEMDVESNDDFIKAVEDGEQLIHEWIKLYADSDRMTYDVVAVEKKLTVRLNDEIDFTFRPDVVLHDKSNDCYVLGETKTTSWSDTGAFNDAEKSDQITAYIFGWNKLNPDEKIEYALPDILYKRGNVIKCSRPGQIYRTKSALKQFEKGMYGRILRISQKVQAVKDGYDPDELFYRSGWCDSYKFACPYTSICRTDLNSLPVNLILESQL